MELLTMAPRRSVRSLRSELPRGFCILHSAFCILKSRVRLLPCSLALSLLFFACNPNPSNYHEQMTVYSTLDPGLTHQVVVVDRTYRVDEPALDSAGVSGAIVRLWRENSLDTIAFVESTRVGFYRDTMPFSCVSPCSTYVLDVAWQGFHGSVSITVPDTFSFIRPVDSETLSVVQLPALVWSHSLRARQYRIRLTAPGGRDSLFRMPLVTQDTFMPVYPGMFDTLGWYGLHAYSLDDHLYAHNKPGFSMDTIGENVLANVGAHTVDSIRVFIRP